MKLKARVIAFSLNKAGQLDCCVGYNIPISATSFFTLFRKAAKYFGYNRREINCNKYHYDSNVIGIQFELYHLTKDLHHIIDRKKCYLTDIRDENDNELIFCYQFFPDRDTDFDPAEEISKGWNHLLQVHNTKVTIEKENNYYVLMIWGTKK